MRNTRGYEFRAAIERENDRKISPKICTEFCQAATSCLLEFALTQAHADWFSRYHFRQPLGKGGMGVTYLAEDRQQNNALCVVKHLLLTDIESPDYQEAVRLFKRETDMLRALDHPGIVRLFDNHVTENGKYYLVMDYVPGQNLGSIISEHGAFNSEAAVEIGIQCCEILEHLHEHEPAILYRDLKPSNLMLTPEGQIVFIDFGIARTFAPKDEATRVVTTGYSPPEQYFGRPETRSDLYALGATLFELLTGMRPKPLSTSAPRQYDRTVLTSLDDLIQRLTSHSPEDRPASARLVRYELYRIYNQIHPDFVVPDEATGPSGALTHRDRMVIEEDQRTKPKRVVKDKKNYVRMSQDYRKGSGQRGDGAAGEINDSILWDGIKRILQLFKR